MRIDPDPFATNFRISFREWISKTSILRPGHTFPEKKKGWVSKMSKKSKYLAMQLQLGLMLGRRLRHVRNNWLDQLFVEFVWRGCQLCQKWFAYCVALLLPWQTCSNRSKSKIRICRWFRKCILRMVSHWTPRCQSKSIFHHRKVNRR